MESPVETVEGGNRSQSARRDPRPGSFGTRTPFTERAPADVTSPIASAFQTIRARPSDRSHTRARSRRRPRSRSYRGPPRSHGLQPTAVARRRFDTRRYDSRRSRHAILNRVLRSPRPLQTARRSHLPVSGGDGAAFPRDDPRAGLIEITSVPLQGRFGSSRESRIDDQGGEVSDDGTGSASSIARAGCAANLQPSSNIVRCHGLGRSPQYLDTAGRHLQLSTRTRRDNGVVGDQNDRPTAARKLGEQIQDGSGGCRVEVASRLVDQEEIGPQDERTRNRDTLLLPARQLCRISFFGSRQSDRSEKPRHGQPLGRQRVPHDRSGRSTPLFTFRNAGGETLEYKAQATIPESRLPTLLARRRCPRRPLAEPAVRSIQTPEHVQQRRFAAPRRAGNGYKVTEGRCTSTPHRPELADPGCRGTFCRALSRRSACRVTPLSLVQQDLCALGHAAADLHPSLTSRPDLDRRLDRPCRREPPNVPAIGFRSQGC